MTLAEWILAIGSWGLGILGFFGCNAAMWSPVLMGPPGIKNDRPIYGMIYSLIAFPISCLICIPLGRWLFEPATPWLGLAVLYSPLLCIVSFVVFSKISARVNS